MADNETITITFGGQVENHVGMEKIGKIADAGFTVSDLRNAEKIFKKKCVTELIILNDYIEEDTYEAAILIIRDGVKAFANINSNKLWSEQKELHWDTKAYMYGRTVNKRARYNLCYADFSQEPAYDNGKGRVVDFVDLPVLATVRRLLPSFCGDKTINLLAEGNYYYNSKECGLGLHGDSERKIVIAIRLGASIPLRYMWFYKCNPVGEICDLVLNDGDMYVMSEKATGNDWKKRNSYTLRHAAGAAKYLAFKKKKDKK